MSEGTNNDETELYNDLKGFLESSRTDVRRSATAAVLELVRDAERRDQVVGLILPLVKNGSYPDSTVATQALQALVLLTSHPTTAHASVEALLQAGGLNRLVELVLTSSEESENDSWKALVNYSLSLLANLTRTETGAVELVGRTLPDEAVYHTTEELPLAEKPVMELLLARFRNHSYIESTVDYTEAMDGAALDSQSGDPYQHFAAVLLNATQVELGRRFVLRIHRQSSSGNEEGTSVLQRLLPQLRSPNPIRRRGIAGVIRNCCLDKDSSYWLLNQVRITKHLLYPLAGPEELDVDEKKGLDPDLWLEGPDKIREPDYCTRLFLVESILLLCASGRASRKQLRLERVYVILKWADMVEEHEDVSECINECVQFLRRDEEGTAEGSSDKLVHDTYNRAVATRPVSSGADFDDVD